MTRRIGQEEQPAHRMIEEVILMTFTNLLFNTYGYFSGQFSIAFLLKK